MRLAVFGLVVALTGCMKMPDTREADVKALKDLEVAWLKTAAAKDVDGFVGYYTDDAHVLMPNAPLFTGKAAIKDVLKPMMADSNFSLVFTPNRVEVSKSSDLGFTQGSYKMTFSDIRGNKFEDEGKYLTVYRKLADGTWKAVEDTMMSDLPLPPPEN
jgi:ketosteroid isomerase-like protein